MPSIDFVYFGGEPLGVPVLERLVARGLRPRAVVTSPDRPAGRGRTLTPPPTKLAAIQHNIPVLQPTSLAEPEFLKEISGAELFVVVAFNKILPADFIALPTHGTLNLHPSLLPHYRGPSPIRSAILDDARTEIGVSIMQLDEKMDHGPLYTQAPYKIDENAWPPDGQALDTSLALFGADLLGDTMLSVLQGEKKPTPQDHEVATYTQKFTKDMGCLEINPYDLPRGEASRQALLKIRAFSGWPGTFFIHQDKRIKLLDATIENDTLTPLTVTPEGKKPMSWMQFLNTLK